MGSDDTLAGLKIDHRIESKILLKKARTHPHLATYLNLLREKNEEVPIFHEKLTRDMKALKQINVLYPAQGPILIHIFAGPKGRNVYQPIEPEFDQAVAIAYDLVTNRLTDLITVNHIPHTKQQHLEMFNELINRIVKGDRNSFLSKIMGGGGLRIPRAELERVRYYFVRNRIGLGQLEPLIRDPYIEDISCVGLGNFFVEHKIFGSCEAEIAFEIEKQLDHFVLDLAERTGRPATHMNPIVDATLPDGSRINIVYGKDISRKGSNFTIRKISEVPYSPVELIDWKTWDSRIGAYLWMALDNGMSLFVVGETASGKTTTLNAALSFIHPNAKIVSIEDTPEVNVPHANWLREVTRAEHAGAGVDIFDLMKAALRQRPNYIIIGEIRGEEGNIAFQAMQTGHPITATFHAGSVKELINRLTGTPINVPPAFIGLLDIVLIQLAVRKPDGELVRRIVSINEIVGYNSSTDKFSFVELFSWDPAEDTFIFRQASHVLENKIGKKRGLKRTQIKGLYRELEIRRLILEAFSELKITDYYKIYGILGLFKDRNELPDEVNQVVRRKMAEQGV